MNYRRDVRTCATRAGALETFATPNSSTRLLVMAPHPDDETLGAGGALHLTRQNGGAARIVFLTCGDGSRSTQLALHLRKRRYYSFRNLARLRREEAKDAARVLGLEENEVVFLGYPDGGLRDIWQKHPTAERLYRSKTTRARRSPYLAAQTLHAKYCAPSLLHDVTRAIADFQPNIIVTTHPNDTHPDHATTFAATRAALHNLQRDASTRDFAKRCRVLTYLVHRGVWPVPHGYHRESFLAPPPALCHNRARWLQLPLNDEALEAKTRALYCHDSQMLWTPRYLRGFLRRNELFCDLDV
jgi:LmbE family N-acetylglucosaminyl deacetylase